jgi:ankyrin repeat protein
MKTGANVDAVDYERDTPLHLASRQNLRATVQALLMAGASKDVENKKVVLLCVPSNVIEKKELLPLCLVQHGGVVVCASYDFEKNKL